MSHPFRLLFSVTIVCAVAIALSFSAGAADHSIDLFNSGVYTGKDINIKEVVLTDNKEVQITYTTLIETLYYCPGANGKTSDDKIELSFVRAANKSKPNVTYPAKAVEDVKSLEKVIVIAAQGKTIFLNNGTELIQIYPAK